MKFSSSQIRILFLLCAFTAITWQSAAMAAQLQLTWSDNSTDETGFKVQRKTGTTGTYADIASVRSQCYFLYGRKLDECYHILFSGECVQCQR